MVYDEIGLMHDLTDPENPVAMTGYNFNDIAHFESFLPGD